MTFDTIFIHDGTLRERLRLDLDREREAIARPLEPPSTVDCVLLFVPYSYFSQAENNA